VATGERAYVVGVDAETRAVTVGSRERLLSRGARIEQAALAPDVALPITCDVAVRYRGQLQRAHVQRAGKAGLEIRFVEPAHAVVPGQVAVLYDGERVLGGGTIASALADTRALAVSVGASA
jgi:tRNA-specific 2-thiouridylase